MTALFTEKENTFTFRKTKDEKTGIENKRLNVVGKIKVPTVEGILAMINAGGKELELLLSVVESAVVDYAKQILGDDASITSDNFPSDAITFEAIANLPDSERRGRGIPKELWEDFLASYIEVMPAAIGKSEEIVKKQASILQQKFQPLKAHEDKEKILPKFIEMLGIYVNTCKDAEQFSAPVEFLLKKADQFLHADNSANLAENLGF